MDRRYVIGFVAAAVLAVGGWALAQQDQAASKSAAGQKAAPQTTPGQMAGGQIAAAQSGTFVLFAAGDTTILLNTNSGKTWALQRSVEGEVVWLPGKRLDSEEDVMRWKEREEHIKRAVVDRLKARVEAGK